MKYIANPVEVQAFAIVSTGLSSASGAVEVTLDIDGVSTKRTATAEMVARIFPRPGDYWVVQQDGYEYLNPKEVFERKYHRTEPVTMEIKPLSGRVNVIEQWRRLEEVGRKNQETTANLIATAQEVARLIGLPEPTNREEALALARKFAAERDADSLATGGCTSPTT